MGAQAILQELTRRCLQDVYVYLCSWPRIEQCTIWSVYQNFNRLIMYDISCNLPDIGHALTLIALTRAMRHPSISLVLIDSKALSSKLAERARY